MSIVSDIFAGGVAGVLEGVGSVAVKIREAITGEGVLPGDKKGELLVMAAQLEHEVFNAQFQLQQAQIELNKVEAQQGTFRGGWRPFIGWVCGAALCYTFLLKPLLPWILSIALAKTLPAMPSLDMGELLTLLGGMLGLGGFRMVERIKGKV